MNGPKLHIVNTGFFKLDGGAMFGVVPKSMWTKLNPPDDNNLCTWAMRCLLVEYDDRLVLETTITGVGRAKIEHAYELYRDGELVTTATTTLVCLDADGRPRPIPESLELL